MLFCKKHLINRGNPWSLFKWYSLCQGTQWLFMIHSSLMQQQNTHEETGALDKVCGLSIMCYVGRMEDMSQEMIKRGKLCFREYCMAQVINSLESMQFSCMRICSLYFIIGFASFLWPSEPLWPKAIIVHLNSIGNLKFYNTRQFETVIYSDLKYRKFVAIAELNFLCPYK